MSLKQMESAVQQAKLPVGQRTWWPRWLERYARWTRQIDEDRIEIREQALIQLLRSLRDSGKNTYIRLQLVRAIEFYQRHVLNDDSPDLSFFRIKLEEMATREKSAQNGNAGDGETQGHPPVAVPSPYHLPPSRRRRLAMLREEVGAFGWTVNEGESLFHAAKSSNPTDLCTDIMLP